MALFCTSVKSIERLPPTQDALLQHVLRAIYQAGIWATSDQPMPFLPSPDNFGWDKDQVWTPKWMTLLEVSKACQEFISCSCKGKCSRCKCVRANLDCTSLCKCHCTGKLP
ncbi:Hypothetical predicted protein [Paramuricea clavata]|uniref:Uncharacterized protein n=1 Tax=Paramuricea clavata TaxID=317549 RepID=A0A7D9DPT0_PARCT|nr:Hypothetical predicted protein [Paramuricea clavata]